MAKIFVLALLLVAGSVAWAQTCSDSGTLTVTGQGLQTVAPDVAKIYMNVQSTESSATVARDEAATAASAVIEAVGEVEGVKPEDITTQDISVTPQYSYSEDGTTNITGYTFTQRIQVKIVNLTDDTLGAVIDTAVKTGGNLLYIDYIQAELSPELQKAATAAARDQAVADGMATAAQLAKAANITLGPIKSVFDGVPTNNNPQPLTSGGNMYYPAPAPAPSAPPTPITVGESEVTAQVTIEYVICKAA